MATNLPSCFSVEFLEQLLKFLANFTLLKYVKSQRSYGFFNHRRADFWFSNFGFKRALLSLLNAEDFIRLPSIYRLTPASTPDKYLLTANTCQQSNNGWLNLLIYELTTIISFPLTSTATRFALLII